MKHKIKNIPAIPAILTSILSVQSGAAIAKGIFPKIGAASTAALRIGLSAVLLLIFNKPNLKNITAKQWKAVIPYGISIGAMNATFYLSLSKIPLGLAVTLEFIGPLLLAVVGSKRIIDFLWILMAALGIALIAPWDKNSIDIWGACLALIAGGFWAAYIVLGGRISKIMDGGTAVTVGMMVATIVVLPFAIFAGGMEFLNFKLLGLALALALLSSAIPFTLEINALKQIPARTFSILMSLEPAAAALCGIIFLNEHLTLLEWLAIILVISASAGATLTKPKDKVIYKEEV